MSQEDEIHSSTAAGQKRLDALTRLQLEALTERQRLDVALQAFDEIAEKLRRFQERLCRILAAQEKIGRMLSEKRSGEALSITTSTGRRNGTDAWGFDALPHICLILERRDAGHGPSR